MNRRLFCTVAAIAVPTYAITTKLETGAYRAFIDVSNLPKTKAEQYLRDIMNQYRNKIVYDAQIG